VRCEGFEIQQVPIRLPERFRDADLESRDLTTVSWIVSAEPSSATSSTATGTSGSGGTSCPNAGPTIVVHSIHAMIPGR
jgi:hypothetical protein